MSKIMKISFFGAWIGEFIFLPITQTVWFVSVSQQGWPETRISEIAQNDDGFLISVIFKSFVVSNIPDYLSILLYVKMYFLANKTVQPEIEMQSQEPYGGIWVGEDDLGQQESNSYFQALATNSQHQDKMRSILRFLRFNAIICLFDLAYAVVWDLLICQGTVGRIVCFAFQNLVCYWLPMLTLSINFKKFRNFWNCNQNFAEIFE